MTGPAEPADQDTGPHAAALRAALGRLPRLPGQGEYYPVQECGHWAVAFNATRPGGVGENRHELVFCGQSAWGEAAAAAVAAALNTTPGLLDTQDDLLRAVQRVADDAEPTAQERLSARAADTRGQVIARAALPQILATRASRTATESRPVEVTDADVAAAQDVLGDGRGGFALGWGEVRAVLESYAARLDARSGEAR